MGVAQVPIWNVPYQRNPLFTGREDVLKRLSEALRAGKTAALAQPQAISGLGGIGKTQTAVEYAYRYRDDYRVVLWVKAETQGSINSDFVTIAHLLNLAEKQEQDQHKIVEAVKRWFQGHTDWLLVLDNADDLAMVQGFLPLGSKGHILLTTRAHATGRIVKRIEVEKMDPDEGALFLLRRSTLLDSNALLEGAQVSDRNTAREIVKAMDGLPLALEQAGAYMEETACGLQGYVRLYRAQGVQLLKEHSEFVPDHPEPVATTWSLSFEKVGQANAAAAELLRFCAFLAPDAIPEELFAESAAELGPMLEPVAPDPSRLNAAIRELLKYSLVQRDPETQTLSIHRLVQEVLKDQMDEDVQCEWAERAVRAVNRAFPAVEFENWDQCRRMLTHAQTCEDLITQWHMELPEASNLLGKAGSFQQDHGLYVESEPLLQLALTIDEKRLGPGHPDVASRLINLVGLYHVHGRFAEAEPLSQRALAMSEQTLGPDHPGTATALHALAGLYWGQGKYAKSEALFQRALAISEKALGPDHPSTAATLNYLAHLNLEQGKYAESEVLVQRALEINAQALGPDHPDIATILNNLAHLYRKQGRYAEAEPLLQRALAISEKAFGPDHPGTAAALDGMADLYQAQGKYAEAETLFQRSLAIMEQTLGPDHPKISWTLDGLAKLYHDQGKYAEAEPLFQRSLAIREQAVGPDHHATAITLSALAELYYDQGKYAEAEPLYKRALVIREQAVGPDHPGTVYALEQYARLLRQMQRTEEAAQFEERIRELRARRTS